MQEVRAIRPDREVLTRQRLPYFVGISGQTVGASGLSMHLVTIPPGARSEPHCHVGYETGVNGGRFPHKSGVHRRHGTA